MVTHSKYWKDDSFIKLGPLKFLIKTYGEEAVFVIHDADVGITDGRLVSIDLSMLKSMLEPPLRTRLSRKQDASTFNSQRSGHIIKLIVGLIQEYGALSQNELDELLLHLDVYVPTERLGSYLLCAISVRWITQDRRGHTTYYFSTSNRDAATIRVREGAAERNRMRRRALIREYWKIHDPSRYAGIVAATSQVRS